MNLKSKEEIAAEMDAAAVVAKAELQKLPKAQIKVVAGWVAKHYLKAGYRRIGRMLVAAAKE